MINDNGSQRLALLWVCALLLLPLVGCAPATNAVSGDASAPNDTAEPAAASANGGETIATDETATDAKSPSAASDNSQPAESPAAQPAASEPAPVLTAGNGPDAKTFSASGTVIYDGSPPERRPIDMKRDEKCLEIHGEAQVLSEDLLVSDAGGMKNVFVYVRSGVPKKDYPIPEQIAVLDQKGCMYRPRIQGVRAGQTFQIVNSDPLLHNIRGFPTRNRPFNIGQKPGSEPRERVFKRPERPIEVQCDVHTWMTGYVFVMDHPFFAVSDEDGRFSIDGLPPGEYTVSAWHEKYRRELRQNIVIGQQDVADADFTFPTLGE